ncbi:hypothetical protein [uncultured Tenacibaculum sp.]|uniref:hypothetical protein n=1 Tax=uncultured Tenacibaculum sp. TaxID=174713 RepID=UPI00262133D7|nr:hypothetical protein [uncultured Tenacibaculum sp.]
MKKKQVTKNIKIKSYLIGIGTTLIVSISLFSSPFKRYSEEFLKHKPNYNKIIKSRDFSQDSLLNELGKTLSIEQYKLERQRSWGKHQEQLREYQKKKKVIVKNHSFRGRTNFKFWLVQFGIIFLGFYMSVKSLYNDLKQPNDTGHKWGSLSAIFVTLFWLYHLFFKTANDFYQETYIISDLLIAVFATFFVRGLIKYYATKKSIISELVDLLIRIKKIHFKGVAVKAKYAEKHDKSLDCIETVDNQIDQFDKDINQTIEKITK